MKKVIAVILMFGMLAGTVSFGESFMDRVANFIKNSPTIETVKTMGTDLVQYAQAKFKDVKAGEWYMDSVSKLVGLGGIAGYEDGTFRPSGTITRAEYVSIVARSLGIQPQSITGGHWSAGIMAAATEAGLVQAGEFTDVTLPITRYEMAKMAVRAVTYQKEAIPTDWADYTSLLSDLRNSSTVDREAASMSVAMGIISGYPDKTFQGTKTLSRAEAAAVVIRILDKEARKIPAKPSPVGVIDLGETKPVTEFVSNMPVFNMYNTGLKTVTLVTPESLGMTKYLRQAPYKDDIRLTGHGALLAIIKDGEVIATRTGTYAASINQTLYDGRYFGAEIGEIDYFGFFQDKWGDTPAGIKLVANPWKE